MNFTKGTILLIISTPISIPVTIHIPSTSLIQFTYKLLLSHTICTGATNMENKFYRFLVHSLCYFSREWRMCWEIVKLVSHLAGTDWTYLDRPNIPAHK